jgi:hypothetical protein
VAPLGAENHSGIHVKQAHERLRSASLMDGEDGLVMYTFNYRKRSGGGPQWFSGQEMAFLLERMGRAHEHRQSLSCRPLAGVTWVGCG